MIEMCTAVQRANKTQQTAREYRYVHIDWHFAFAPHEVFCRKARLSICCFVYIYRRSVFGEAT